MAKQTKVTHEDRIVEISKLKEFVGNPNIHSANQIEALAQSMERYGQYYPIICDENLTILCGHGKKMALEKKGETKAKVTILHGLSETQKKKLLLEDNKIQGMSMVNYSMIEEIIKDIGELDIIGFSQEYLDTIINEVTSDNMGVDFSKKPESKQVFTEETKQDQDTRLEMIEEGMVGVKTIKCPHCGEQINI